MKGDIAKIQNRDELLKRLHEDLDDVARKEPGKWVVGQSL
jgi:hypothetical protein